jgi:hypothetical protein
MIVHSASHAVISCYNEAVKCNILLPEWLVGGAVGGGADLRTQQKQWHYQQAMRGRPPSQILCGCLLELTCLVSCYVCRKSNCRNFLILITIVHLWYRTSYEWLTLLLRISKVPSSNLGQETGYSVWGYSWFSLVPPGKYRDILIRPRPLPSTSFHVAWVTGKEC